MGGQRYNESLRNKAWKCRLNSSGSEENPTVGSWEQCNELLVSTKLVRFLDLLRASQLLENDSVPKT
jgi:hypothetical protein